MTPGPDDARLAAWRMQRDVAVAGAGLLLVIMLAVTAAQWNPDPAEIVRARHDVASHRRLVEELKPVERQTAATVDYLLAEIARLRAERPTSR